MRNFDELKQLLVQIKNDVYRVSDDCDINGLVTDMLRFIGHTDPKLRDDLIYSTFCEWSENGVISPDRMKNILSVCLDEQHLFFGIGEKNTDSVFTRTFSMLIIPLALMMNLKDAFLTETEELNIKETVLRYVKQEKDFRGFVDNKGWAHSIAHAADALCEIAKMGSIRHKDLLQILDVIKETMSNSESVYAHQEDERMVTAFVGVYYRRVLTDKDICDWLNSFRATEREEFPIVTPFNVYRKVNQKSFLRSLYFRILPKEDFKQISTYLTDMLQGTYAWPHR